VEDAVKPCADELFRQFMPAKTPNSPRPPIDYHTWRQRSMALAGRRVMLVTKPGLLGHGRDDVAATLLAERVTVNPGDVVVQMQCGSGLFGAVASLAHGASRVLLTDRSIVSVEGARRTIADNGIENAEVFLGQGSAALPADVEADVVAIRIPTEKLAMLQLLVDAFSILRIGGRCSIAGATNEGVKSAARVLQELFGNATVVGHDSGHRVVMAVKRSTDFANGESVQSPYLQHDAFLEIDATLRGQTLKLFSRPGVFSWEHIDEATEILADTMEVRAGESVLDLGCGIGVLGMVAAQLSGTGAIHFADVDSEAVRCTQRAIDQAGLANCAVSPSDVGAAVMQQRFDVVVCNPPFHVGKTTDLEVPAQFILDAWQVLKPGGRMYLVANRTLPYEKIVHQRFGNVTAAHDGPRFKVLLATR
jgi:16S rRNA (guanine1207-N2)-methyltransferase